MSITKFMVISCDALDCSTKTPLIDLKELAEVGEDEDIRSDQGFSFVDVPFSNYPDLYICHSCLVSLAGEKTG